MRGSRDPMAPQPGDPAAPQQGNPAAPPHPVPFFLLFFILSLSG